MALFNRGKKKGTGMSPVKAGVIALVDHRASRSSSRSRATTRSTSPYEFTATFKSANNLKQKSPVRIARRRGRQGHEGRADRRAATAPPA